MHGNKRPWYHCLFPTWCRIGCLLCYEFLILPGSTRTASLTLQLKKINDAYCLQILSTARRGGLVVLRGCTWSVAVLINVSVPLVIICHCYKPCWLSRRWSIYATSFYFNLSNLKSNHTLNNRYNGSLLFLIMIIYYSFLLFSLHVG